ncbi:hypothetical protein EVAR_91052_1 [Eumeta japonica]|uniref:Uncharacterized protein n=1 Tax=Eumeta variegata TaxID=151549 RepID=A0A4C1Z8Y3_EUMVA|nr:hypothetical protein EVAR_91052_1 [Eumeta japonica]
MFNNRIERKKSNIRRNFIKQLGLSLLEDHLRKRKDNPHVPRDIRKRIHQILDEEVPGPPQKQPKKSQSGLFGALSSGRSVYSFRLFVIVEADYSLRVVGCASLPKLLEESCLAVKTPPLVGRRVMREE